MRRTRIALMLVLATCLLLTTGAIAMSSPNYAIDWMYPLSGGGGNSSSTHYTIQLTIGQTAIGSSENASFQAGIGFWYGLRDFIYDLFLPMIFLRL
jgi:hypothetical protein